MRSTGFKAHGIGGNIAGPLHISIYPPGRIPKAVLRQADLDLTFIVTLCELKVRQLGAGMLYDILGCRPQAAKHHCLTDQVWKWQVSEVAGNIS